MIGGRNGPEVTHYTCSSTLGQYTFVCIIRAMMAALVVYLVTIWLLIGGTAW